MLPFLLFEEAILTLRRSKGPLGSAAAYGRIKKQRMERTVKEEDAYTCLQILNEMTARGLEFLPVDSIVPHATRYLPENGKLRLPFCSLKGLGKRCSEFDGSGSTGRLSFMR